jgi:translocator protein
MGKKDFLRLSIAIIVCLSAGFIGSFFTITSIGSWYSTLNKPIFNPPNWLFGPVWTFLYFLMGISLYLIWQNKNKTKKTALTYFFIQLALNTLWSILFFGLQTPLLAFVEIIILWAAIFLTIRYSYKISKTAAYLLIPYLLWVSFAAILNLSIYLLNR